MEEELEEELGGGGRKCRAGVESSLRVGVGPSGSPHVHLPVDPSSLAVHLSIIPSSG